MEDFCRLLDSLASPDNALRSSAEKHLERLRCANQAQLVQSLIAVVQHQGGIASHLRSLGVILLRRILVESSQSEDSVGYYALPEEMRVELRAQLVSALVNEKGEQILRNNLCDLVGKLGAILIDDSGDWPQILPLAQQLLSSQSSQDRETGLRLLEWLAMSQSFSEILTSPQALPAVLHTLTIGLTEYSNEGRVMLAAARALCNFTTHARLESTIDEFKLLNVAINEGLRALAVEQIGISERCGSEFISFMISIASEKPSFFGSPHLAPTLSTIANLLQQTLVEAVRNQLVEFLVSLCEAMARDIRRLKDACPAILGLLATFMTELNDDLSNTGVKNDVVDDDDDDDGDDDGDGALGRTSIVCIAEDAYDRVCTALGVNATFPIVLDHVKSYLGSQNATWQQNRAGLIILGNYLSLSARHKDLTLRVRHLHDVTGQVLHFCCHSVPRVRLASFAAMIQLIVQGGDQLPDDSLRAILAAALGGINVVANASPLVRRSAMTCIINLLDVLPEAMLEEQSISVLTETVGALSAGPLRVQELCVSVLVALAQAIKNKTHFSQFYNVIIPVLRQLLVYAESNSLVSLWGQAIECYSIVGEASGPQFVPDAHAIMQSLVNAEAEAAGKGVDPSGGGHSSTRQTSISQMPEAQIYVIKVWVRLARCLGTEFLQFLPLVMGKIAPHLQVDISSGTGDIDLDDPNVENRSDIEVVEDNSGMLLAVRCTAVEEQVAACELVRLLMASTKEGFFQYAESTSQALIPLLRSPHEDVRTFSLVAFPELVNVVARSRQREPLELLMACIIDQVVHVMKEEAVFELIMTGLQVLRRCIRDASTDWGRLEQYERAVDDAVDDSQSEDISLILTPQTSIPILNISQLKNVSSCAKGALRDSLQRRAVMRAEAHIHGKDADDEDEEVDFMSFTLEMHYNVCELIGSMLCTHSGLFLSIYLEEWHPLAQELVHPHCLKEDRVVACSLLADVLQYGFSEREDLSTWLNPVMESLLDACANGQSSGLRRLAAFGIGKAVERFPASMIPYLTPVLNSLYLCVSKGEDNGQTRGPATDNAVWAVGEVILLLTFGGFSGGTEALLDVAGMLSQWLDYLPLRHDVDEGRTAARQLLRMIIDRNEVLCRSPDKLLTRAIEVLCKIHNDKVLTTPALSADISSTLRSLVSQYPGASDIAAICSSLLM